MDSNGEPGANGVIITAASFRGTALVFVCNGVMASFSGELCAAGAVIEGAWTQLKPTCKGLPRCSWEAAIRPPPSDRQ
jgi:hypothetical protein